MDPFVSEISVMWPLMYTNILIVPSLALLNGLFLDFFMMDFLKVTFNSLKTNQGSQPV